MAWLRVFERCLPLLLSDKPRGWWERPPTQNASTHLCRWNLTSDTVFSVLLPTFVHACCVCGSNSVFGLTSTKKSFFLHKTKRRRPRKFTAKKHISRGCGANVYLFDFLLATWGAHRRIQCDGDVMAVYWILSLTRAFPLAHTSIRVAQIFGELCRCATESGMSLNYELSNAPASPQ